MMFKSAALWVSRLVRDTLHPTSPLLRAIRLLWLIVFAAMTMIVVIPVLTGSASPLSILILVPLGAVMMVWLMTLTLWERVPGWQARKWHN